MASPKAQGMLAAARPGCRPLAAGTGRHGAPRAPRPPLRPPVRAAGCVAPCGARRARGVRARRMAPASGLQGLDFNLTPCQALPPAEPSSCASALWAPLPMDPRADAAALRTDASIHPPTHAAPLSRRRKLCAAQEITLSGSFRTLRRLVDLERERRKRSRLFCWSSSLRNSPQLLITTEPFTSPDAEPQPWSRFITWPSSRTISPKTTCFRSRCFASRTRASQRAGPDRRG